MPGLIGYVLFGGSLAFGAAIQPGPFQAFLVSRTVAAGWRRTLPACLAPVLSDGPVAALAVLVLGRMPSAAQHVLRAAGGVLLICLAVAAFRHFRRPTSSLPVSSPRTLLEAMLVNVLNPNPYMGWALVLGPAVVGAWRRQPGLAVGLILAFYVTLSAMQAAIVVAVGTARFLNAERQRALVWASAFLLAGIGVVLLVAGARESLGDLLNALARARALG